MLDLSVEPSEHFISQGVLRNIAMGEIKAGECRNVLVPLCALSCGSFEVCAEVRDLETVNRKVGSTKLQFRVESDKTVGEV